MDKGENVTFERVLADLRKRDEQDRARSTAPLKPAEDAHLLDTSDLAIEAAVTAAVDIIAAALKP
jgi:cytidylate kinase